MADLLATSCTGLGDTDKVKVAIRVRPFNRREIELKTNCVVEVKKDQTILHYVHASLAGQNSATGKSSSSSSTANASNSYHNHSQSNNNKSNDSANNNNNNTNSIANSALTRPPKTFTFDHCFWSFEETDPHYASQEYVFEQLGLSVLDSAFQGYNACIFAYGQTGSGKSFTMMGSSHEKGLIPRLCDTIFERIRAQTEIEPSSNFKLEVSYMEIYNEKVHDLLDPGGARQSLKVREHNILGPYVDGLSTLAVSSFEEIDSLMAEGNKSRTVAATNMNSESSRSHAVFTLTLTCSVYDSSADVRGERVSKMSLVDLAGSERAVKTGAVGERLKEGSNINKSLTTLGLVISKLADQASGKKREQFVPYRDSVLTWLLKDNLGGNSKTIMISTISPAADSYEETLSTLRYADRAKRIVNHAIINEDPNNRIIRELREEVEQLREQLMHATVQTELQERLVESEKLIREMEQTWEEKLHKTEKIHQERQLALEKMGISVQSSGIAVEKDRFYLVNLNADPSMNALLVYYLKETTLIGRPDSGVEQDIQLSGVGMMLEHAVINVDKERNELWMEPINEARTYVNGVRIHERVKLRNGDRILWGNNHFFSLNCPVSTNMNKSIYEDSSPNYFDYNFARDELLSYNNPGLEAAMFALERQFEDPSLRAPNQQWPQQITKMGQIQGHNELNHQVSGSTNFLHGSSKFGGSMIGRLGGSSLNLSSPSAMASYIRMEKLAQEREENLRISLSKLREEIAKANTLAHEANLIAEEMRKNTEFKVTLQIPAANLSPNRLRRGVFVSEPAILVKRKGCSAQVWTMDKFDINLIEMRELYAEWKERLNQRKLNKQGSIGSEVSVSSSSSVENSPQSSPSIQRRNDPFYEFQENHLLIGVANIFLDVLMQDVMIDYQIPIISQQGEVAGRLHVEFGRIEGHFGERMADASASDADTSCSDDGSNDGQECATASTNSNGSSPVQQLGSNQIRVRLNIKSSRGLPHELSNFVFCQYSVWGYPDLIAVPVTSIESADASSNPKAMALNKLSASNEQIFMFNNQRDFIINLSEEFLEHCADGALSIEVWGHRISALSPNSQSLKPEWGIADEQMKISRSLADRWLELKRKFELWVEIHELNDQGEYTPVEVETQPDIYTAGVYQLRQGQQRRISVKVVQVLDSGTLPLICESICSIAVGCVCVRNKVQKSLDSYQEGDLTILREKWTEILKKRQDYLQEQINELMTKPNKSSEEIEREHRLMNQWVSLVEERNASKCPLPGSEIPGAPIDNWEPPVGMESHIPVIFLDLNTDGVNISTTRINELAGLNSILPKEYNGSPFFSLPIVSTDSRDGLSAVGVWDSSMHESAHLNRVTSQNERIFLIIKVIVRLSHPVIMDLVLRKRIAINVYKKQSLTVKNIFKRISRADIPLMGTAITYEIVSSIPKASEDIEDRESLALLAASGVDLTACDGESYIERYTKSVSAVEGILTLDRLRQEVAVREQLAKKAKYAMQHSAVATPTNNFINPGSEAFLRKTVSVPNMANIVQGPNSRSANKVTTSPNETMTTSLNQRVSASAANTPTGANPRSGTVNGLREKSDSSFDLSYITSAADRLRQKASSIFGSMTGLNQLVAGESDTDEKPLNSATAIANGTLNSSNESHSSSRQTMSANAIRRPNFLNLSNLTTFSSSVKSNSSPSTPLISPLTTSTSGKLKPMCTLPEEQYTREDDELPESENQRRLKQGESIQVQVTPPKLDHRNIESSELSDTEDTCCIVFESSNNSREIHLMDDDENDEEVARLVKSQNHLRADNSLTPTLSISSSSGYEGNSLSQATNNDLHTSGTPVSSESVPCSLPSSLSVTSSTNGSGDEEDNEDLKSSNDFGSIETMETFTKKPPLPNTTVYKQHGDIPDWMVVGECVRISPDSKLGVIAFIGDTEFATGTWVGVVLDTPTGKNDGAVNGVSYFQCKPKFGIFVRPDKLKLDARGRAARQPTEIKVNGNIHKK